MAAIVVAVVALGCSVVFFEDADATSSTVYVGGVGASDDTGDGTRDAPFASVTRAIGATSSGGTVVFLGDVETTSFMVEKTRLSIDLGGHNLTIAGGSQSSGISFFGSTYEIRNGTIIDSRDTERAGGFTAISLGAGQNLTVTGVEVRIDDSLNSSSSNNTGYIANPGSTLTLIDSRITSVPAQNADSGSVGIIVLGTGNMTNTTMLSIQGTTSISVGQFGISGNGSIVNDDGTSSGGDDTGVTVSSGRDYRGTTISIQDEARVEARNGWGIYHPQDGTLTISDDAVVSGLTGIEMRSGTLEVDGGTVTSTAEATTSEPNGGGPTTVGAAIAIVQHTTKLDLNVGIHDGADVTGPTAVYQSDLQDNGLEGTSKISILIDGGVIESSASGDNAKAVDVADVTGFIIGGNIAGSVSENAIRSGYGLGADGSVQAENPVASVGDRTFATLEDAISQLKDGDTLLLLDNVAVDYLPGDAGRAVPVFQITADVEINLSGHSITWKSPVEGENELEYVPVLFAFIGCHVIITGNGSIDAELGNTTSYGINLMSGANLTIENGTFKGAPTAIQVQSGTLTILGGSFDLSDTVKSQAADSMAKYVINCIDSSYRDGSADVLIEGGSFGYDYSNNPEGEGTSYCSPGYKITPDSDGTYSASPITRDEAYFQAGDLYFMDLQSAIDSIGDSGTVTLLKDAESTPVTISDGVSLDLGGFELTISTTANIPGVALIGGSSVIQNGAITVTCTTGKTAAISVSGADTELVLENVTITYPAYSNNNGVEVKGGASLTMNSGASIISGYSGTSPILTTGVFLEDGSEASPSRFTMNERASIDADAFGVSGNGGNQNRNYFGTVATINGGTIDGLTGIEIRSGSAEINGGTITGFGRFNEYDSGNGNTADGVALIVSQHTYTPDIDIIVRDGEFTGFYAFYQADLTGEDSNDPSKIDVTISGGTFSTTNSGSDISGRSPMAVSAEDIEDFIIGGKFPNGLDSKYIRTGYGLQAGTVVATDPAASIDGCGFATFEDALIVAESGDTIVLHKSVIVDSELSVSNVIIIRDDTLTSSMFQVGSGGVLNMDGCTITGVNTTGVCSVPIHITGGIATITNSKFEGNSSVSMGGAIYINGGSLEVSKSTFDRNSAVDCGGAVYIWSSTSGATVASFVGCTFTNNTSELSGGAIYDYGASLTIEGCTFRGNSAVGYTDDVDAYGGHGGAIYIDAVVSGMQVSIKDTDITDNHAGDVTTIGDETFGYGNAGGIYVYSAISLTLGLDGVTVSGNTAIGGQSMEDVYLRTDFEGTVKVSLSGECDLGSGFVLDDYDSSVSSQPFIELNDGFSLKDGTVIELECNWPPVDTQIVSGDADPSMFSLVNAGDLILKKTDDGLVLAESVEVTFETYRGSTTVKLASGDVIPSSAYPTQSDRTGFAISGWMRNGSIWDAATPVDADIILTATWAFEDGVATIDTGAPGETLLLTASITEYEGVTPTYSWTGPITGTTNMLTATIGGTYTLTVTFTEGAQTKTLNATVTIHTVTFDDTVVQTRILVADGDGIAENSYPEISERDGFISLGWEYADTSAVTSDLNVNALWIPFIDVQVTFSGELVEGSSITATVTTDYVPADGVSLCYMISGMSEPVSSNVFTITAEGDYAFAVYAIIGTIEQPEIVAAGISDSYSIRYAADPGIDPPPFIPFPDDDDVYVPLPPSVVVQQDSGNDDTTTIAACAAAAVAAAILAILLASLYRRK